MRNYHKDLRVASSEPMENNACVSFLLELLGGTLFFDTSEVARADDKLIDVSAFDVLEARETLFKTFLCDNETASSERGGRDSSSYGDVSRWTTSPYGSSAAEDELCVLDGPCFCVYGRCCLSSCVPSVLSAKRSSNTAVKAALNLSTMSGSDFHAATAGG